MYLSPALPMFGIATSSRRKTTTISKRLPNPVGTGFFEFFLATAIATMQSISAAPQRKTTCFVMERSTAMPARCSGGNWGRSYLPNGVSRTRESCT